MNKNTLILRKQNYYCLNNNTSMYITSAIIYKMQIYTILFLKYTLKNTIKLEYFKIKKTVKFCLNLDSC
jgi:hypothetical protein